MARQQRGDDSAVSDASAPESREGGAAEETGQVRLRPSLVNQSSEDTRASSSIEPGTVGGDDGGNEKTTKATVHSHFDPDAGFAQVDGDVGGTGYNETKVDIVTVPCPGADPLETWARDPFPDGFFGGGGGGGTKPEELHPAIRELAGDAILTPAINRHLPRAAHIWVRQGIRKFVNTARVMLYRHREIVEGTDLDALACDLLDHVLALREGQRASRPLFFIAHSIGGLVVKLAILKASKLEKFRGIWYNCHGVAFFSTPHRGSSYLSMRQLSPSIQSLLHLQRPLPRSISDGLRLGHGPLLKLHDDFTDISSELRIWTFNETIDSLLSGWNEGPEQGVRFSAPLVSIKSGLVGVRQEQVYSLDSDHAHGASFGPANRRTMGSFLQDLAATVRHAEHLSSRYIHTPLNLSDHVKVEVIGFYEDPDADMESAIRLYTTKYHLSEFLEKGPEACLEERLRKVPKGPGSGKEQALVPPGSAGSTSRGRGNSGLDIWSNVQKMWRATRAGDSSSRTRESEITSPDIVVTRPTAGTESKSLPASAMRRVQTLTVPPLSPPDFQRPASQSSKASTMSEPLMEDTSPKSGKPSPDADLDDDDEPGTHTGVEQKDFEEPVLRSRAERLSKTTALQDLTAGFSRPDPNRRKFMWIHLPFTNPPWVKTIFGKLSEAHSQDFSKLFSNQHWVSRHIQGRHSQSQPSFVKPACSFITGDPPTLATFFSKRESKPKEGTLFQQADLRNSIYNELNGDLTGRTENALDLAAFVALHAVTVLLERSSHPDLEIFRIFEEAIGMLTERMTYNLKQFRMQTFTQIVDDSDSDPDEENKSESIKKRHRRELEKAERENRENTSALLELRDMEDELKTLARLFDTQTTTIKTMHGLYGNGELAGATSNGLAYLDEALARLGEYRAQTSEMLDRVDATRKDYEKLLEMSQRQAQVEDVRISRLQTELASSQNLSVMIFTTFTVIFLPLTFFTGLFGMNTQEWGGGDFLPLWKIGSISLPASIFLLVASLVAAFSSRVQSVVKALFRAGRRIVGIGKKYASRLEPEASKAAKERRADEKEKAELARGKKKGDRGYDFWATVRRQRASEYQIPDINKKPPGFGLGTPRHTWRSKR